MLGRGLQSLIPPSDPQGNSGPNVQPVQPAQAGVNQQNDFAKEESSAPQNVGIQNNTPNSTPEEANKIEEDSNGSTHFEPFEESAIPVEENVHSVTPDNQYVPPASEVNIPAQPTQQERGIKSHPKMPDAIFHIEVDKIKQNPDQPRRNFDENGIRDLAASIREFGLLQPIVVSKVEYEVPTGTAVDYVLISGERRLLASKLLGMERIPAIIRNIDFNRERLELAIIENIQRENLNAIEIARSFSRLQDEFRLTQREIAARLGKSREVVANTMRLLDLSPAIQEAIERGEVSESHGRLLLAIDDPAAQERLFRDLVAQRFTTRELRRRVDMARASAGGNKEKEQIAPEFKMMQKKLSEELGAPVAIQKNGDTGKITITFYSQEELQNILQKLERETG